jgi:L-fuculose-phosphate aldolase
MFEAEARKLLVKYGRLIYENGLIAGTDGNLSIRLDDGSILITPAGKAKGYMAEDDMVLVTGDGQILSQKGRPSSELLMHLAVYKRRIDINACCHAHPPFATAFSAIGRRLPGGVLPEVIISIGDIPLTDYAPPGTDAVPEALEQYLEKNQAFILKNHGVLTIGRDMIEAYNRMETVEHYAKIIYIAETRGKLNILDNEEIRRLDEIRRAKMRDEE